MTLYLVEYRGMCEIEADSASDAESIFDGMANALMGCGMVSYTGPLTESQYQERQAAEDQSDG